MSGSNLENFLATGVIFCVGILSWGTPSFAQEAGTQETAKQWEEIASLRFQAAIGHESRAEQKVALGSDNPGEALYGAGEAKVSASGNYKVASEYWKKSGCGIRNDGRL